MKPSTAWSKRGLDHCPVVCKPDLDMQVQQPRLSTSKELQCPMFFLMFPMQHIQEQADNCSPWAMELEQSPDLSGFKISVEMEESAKQLPQLNMSQYKSLLKDEIASCPTRLSTNKKRINVRRGFFWENFKAARISKIGPHCSHSCALWSMVYTRVLYCTETSGGIWFNKRNIDDIPVK